MVLSGSTLAADTAIATQQQANTITDPTKDEPPPSTYDKTRQNSSGGDTSGVSLASQITRTLFSLLLVVAIIYALGKFALWRLGRGKKNSVGGLKILEKMSLDARHAVFVVEIFGKHKYLLGTGHEHGVTLLSNLNNTTDTTQASFTRALNQAGGQLNLEIDTDEAKRF